MDDPEDRSCILCGHRVYVNKPRSHEGYRSPRVDGYRPRVDGYHHKR